MKKEHMKKGTVVLALVLALSTGVPVFAAKNTDSVNNSNIETSAITTYAEYVGTDENEYDVRWFDMSKLTEKEQNELNKIYKRFEEIEAAIYGENFDATDDEIANNYSKYETELNELEKKASVLEEKAEDYGNLTEDESRELKNIYDRFEAIGDKIFGDDDSITDEEFESRFSQYESEWNELEQKAEILEKKAWGK